MAGSSATEELASYLECSVCLETLSSHNNKVLPCQHTFCTSCLRDVWAARPNRTRPGPEPAQEPARECPECRTPCATALDDLPSNVLLNRILEGLKNSSAVNNNNNNNKHAAEEQQKKTSEAKPASEDDLSALLDKVKLDVAAALGKSKSKEEIPGNVSTNPFFTMLQPAAAAASAAVAGAAAALTSPAPTLPPKPGFFSNAVAAMPPPLPRPKALARQTGSSGSASHSAVGAGNALTGHQIHRALFNYHPGKRDELALVQGSLYVVTGKFEDGWYRGNLLNHPKTGVFPGNYVQHIKDWAGNGGGRLLQPTKASSPATTPITATKASSLTAIRDTPDLIDLTTDEFLADIFNSGQVISSMTPSPSYPSRENSNLETVKPEAPSLTGPRNPNSSNSSSSGSSTVRVAPLLQPPASRGPRERYRCVMSFPASTAYELDLKEGDVVVLHKKRDDGWAKGTVENTDRAGLFPITFVQKIHDPR